jgi:hypothetical protein
MKNNSKTNFKNFRSSKKWLGRKTGSKAENNQWMKYKSIVHAKEMGVWSEQE